MKNIVMASVIALTGLQAQAFEVLVEQVKAKSATLEIGGEQMPSECYFSAIRSDDGDVSFLLTNNGHAEVRDVVGQVVYVHGDLSKIFDYKTEFVAQKYSGGVLKTLERHDGMAPGSSETNLVEIEIDSKLNVGKAVLTSTKKSFFRSKTTKLSCQF